MTLETVSTALSLPSLLAQAGASDLLRDPRASQMLALVIIFGGGILIGLTAVIGGIWYAYKEKQMNALLQEQELMLKREMIERGLSVDDIQAVLGSGREQKKGFWGPKWFCSSAANPAEGQKS